MCVSKKFGSVEGWRETKDLKLSKVYLIRAWTSYWAHFSIAKRIEARV